MADRGRSAAIRKNHMGIFIFFALEINLDNLSALHCHAMGRMEAKTPEAAHSTS